MEKRLFRFELEKHLFIAAKDEQAAIKLVESVVNQHLVCTEQDADAYEKEGAEPYWFADYVEK